MSSLKAKFENTVKSIAYAEILQDAYELSNISACAGIKGDAELAFRGAVNHYGSYGDNLPARPWLDASTGDSDVARANREFRAAIKAIITAHLTTPQQVARRGIGRSPYASYATTSAQPALSGTKGVGPSRIMKQLADAMANSQRAYIAEGMGTPNRESTVRKKGFNHPLVETGALLANVKGWIDNGNTYRQSEGPNPNDI